MKKIKLIPTLIISLSFISATTAGVIKLIDNQDPNPVDHRNPLVTLDANGGYFTIGTTTPSVISKTVRYGIQWKDYSLNMPTPVKPGYDIKGWEYSLTGEIGSWHNITEGYTFTQNVYVRVTAWGGSSPSSFANDSWATIVEEAKKGLNNLKTVYRNDIAAYGNTFVIRDTNNVNEVNTKTRTIKLKGLGEYKVRVVGEDHDKIANTENQVAALTFEFVETPFPAHGFSSSSNSWVTSSLKRFLDEEFVYRMPEPINDPQVLQVVEKRTYDVSTSQIVTSNDRLFVPSLNEIGFRIFSENGISNTMSKNEGSTYAFYNDNAKSLNSYLKYYTDESGRSQAVPYWTRSAFADSYGSEEALAHVIGNDASVPNCNSDLTPVNTGNAVTPCFCIGTDIAQTVTVNVNKGAGEGVTARWSNFIVNDSDCFVSLFDNCDYTAPLFHASNDYEGDIKEITVKVGSKVIHARQDFYNYDYDSVEGLLTININKDNLSIDQPVTINIDASGLYQGAFASSSWEDFATQANLGYENLKTKYKQDYEDNGNTFVGLKRRITVGSNEYYTVRVIGEQHDTTTDSNGAEHTVPLTFEFTTGIISTDIVQDPDFGTEIKPYGNYSSSPTPTMVAYCEMSEAKMMIDGMVGIHSQTGEEIYETSIPTITNYAQKVNKKVIEYSLYQGGYFIQNFVDKIFLLSYEEYTGLTAGLPDVIGGDKSDEGDQYTYYQIGADCRKVAPYSYPFYWTRSLSNTDTTNAHGVSFQSGVVAPHNAMKPYPPYMFDGEVGGYVPAFGIGIDPIV